MPWQEHFAAPRKIVEFANYSDSNVHAAPSATDGGDDVRDVEDVSDAGISLCLDHHATAMTRKVYNLATKKRVAEKRKVLDAWAVELRRIVGCGLRLNNWLLRPNQRPAAHRRNSSSSPTTRPRYLGRSR